MRDEDTALIQGALDTLATALSGHQHQWTEGERAIYEEAVEILTGKRNAIPHNALLQCPFCGGPSELIAPETVECRVCRDRSPRNSFTYTYDFWQHRGHDRLTKDEIE